MLLEQKCMQRYRHSRCTRAPVWDFTANNRFLYFLAATFLQYTTLNSLSHHFELFNYQRHWKKCRWAAHSVLATADADSQAASRRMGMANLNHFFLNPTDAKREGGGGGRKVICLCRKIPWPPWKPKTRFPWCTSLSCSYLAIKHPGLSSQLLWHSNLHKVVNIMSRKIYNWKQCQASCPTQQVQAAVLERGSAKRREGLVNDFRKKLN